MHRRIKFALITAILSACVFPPTASAAPAWNQVDPVDFTYFVPCANEGAGEDVHFTGERHRFATATFDGAGGAHVSIHERSEGVSGVGLSSGDTYRVIGSSTVTINTTSASTFTARSVTRFIGPGPDNDYFVREVFHFTLDPDGVLRTVQIESEVTCD